MGYDGAQMDPDTQTFDGLFRVARQTEQRHDPIVIDVEGWGILMANPPEPIVTIEIFGSRGVRERYGWRVWLWYKWYVWRDR